MVADQIAVATRKATTRTAELVELAGGVRLREQVDAFRRDVPDWKLKGVYADAALSFLGQVKVSDNRTFRSSPTQVCKPPNVDSVLPIRVEAVPTAFSGAGGANTRIARGVAPGSVEKKVAASGSGKSSVAFK